MTNPAINLRDLIILIADSSSYVRMISHSMLRGFGANKVLEVGQTTGLLQTLSSQKIDILLCDVRLPPHGGLVLTRTIRRNADNVNRTMPILLMSNDTRETTIKSARDAGANMVIAKPMSPKNLYDRLAWIAFSSRNFVDTETYFGPDRRFKIEAIREESAAAKGTVSSRSAGGRASACARRHRQPLQRHPHRIVRWQNSRAATQTYSPSILASSNWRAGRAVSRVKTPSKAPSARSMT
jgi:CheY-like chemotaxis protein